LAKTQQIRSKNPENWTENEALRTVELKAILVDGSGNGYLKTVCDYLRLNPPQQSEKANCYCKLSIHFRHDWCLYRGVRRLVFEFTVSHRSSLLLHLYSRKNAQLASWDPILCDRTGCHES
jgi:hypothetical protein